MHIHCFNAQIHSRTIGALFGSSKSEAMFLLSVLSVAVSTTWSAENTNSSRKIASGNEGGASNACSASDRNRSAGPK